MSPESSDRPRGRHLETGPNQNVTATASQATSITAGADNRLATARQRRRSAAAEPPLTARVSLLVPSGRRRCWWYLATCPHCRNPHLGRARELADVTGPRRLPCGHRVTIAIARTYGRTGGNEAAA